LMAHIHFVQEHWLGRGKNCACVVICKGKEVVNQICHERLATSWLIIVARKLFQNENLRNELEFIKSLFDFRAINIFPTASHHHSHRETSRLSYSRSSYVCLFIVHSFLFFLKFMRATPQVQ
jgi:hypothetical protein